MSTIGSNTGRYTLCPFYRHNSEARITCEDVFRRFDSEQECSAWMDTYCDMEWEQCPFAMDLVEAYDKLEKGDESALDNHKIEALESELKSMTIRLGKLQKKTERQQKKIDELRAVNQSFTSVNQDLEKQKKLYYSKWRDADQQIKEYEKNIDGQLKTLVDIYEQRMAYVIDMYAPGKVIYEDDVEEWAKDRAFAIVHGYEEGRLLWEVKFKETEEDGEVEDDGSEEPDTHAANEEEEQE